MKRHECFTTINLSVFVFDSCKLFLEKFPFIDYSSRPWTKSIDTHSAHHWSWIAIDISPANRLDREDVTKTWWVWHLKWQTNAFEMRRILIGRMSNVILAARSCVVVVDQYHNLFALYLISLMKSKRLLHNASRPDNDSIKTDREFSATDSAVNVYTRTALCLVIVKKTSSVRKRKFITITTE